MRRFLAVALLVGCGSDSHQSSTPDAPPDAPPAQQLGPEMPVAGGGTAVIASPKLVLVTANNDANQADFNTFATQYAASSAWTAQVNEYGVGAFTSTPQAIAQAPTTDQGAIDLITANTTGNNPKWGATDANTVYMFVIPDGGAFDDGTGAKCCTDYFGYHFDAMVGTVDTAYSIVCTCDDSTHPELTKLQVTTSTASHELVEAATDPRFDPPGFSTVDDDHYAWSYATDPELADLCQYADTAYWAGASGIDAKFNLQRTWSNTAAAAGHDPCVGDAATPYYQGVPEAPDAEMFTDGNQEVVNTHVKKIALNATDMVTVHVDADDPTAGPFTVTLDDLGAQELQFTQPTGTFKPGDVIQVPVKVLKADSFLAGKAEMFEVVTAPASGPRTYFYGLIGQ